MKNLNTLLGSLGSAIGKGIIAGIAGTAAMTLSQWIEMRITQRKPSNSPAEAASKVLGVKPVSEEDKSKFTNIIHWLYGTGWGMARGIISLPGVRGVSASALHFAAVYSTALIMLPSLKVAPPVKDWDGKTIAVDVWHHLVYAAVAGIAFELMEDHSRKKFLPA